MMLFLVVETAPLATVPAVTLRNRIGLQEDARAVLADELASHFVYVASDGSVLARRLADGAVAARGHLRPEAADGAPLLAFQGDTPSGWLAAAGGDGQVHVQPVDWISSFVADRRVITPDLQPPCTVRLAETPGSLLAWTVSRSPERQIAAAGQLADRTVVVVQRRITRNEITDEITTTEWRATTGATVALRHMCLDRAQTNLYAASTTGKLLWWRITDAGFETPRTAPLDRARIHDSRSGAPRRHRDSDTLLPVRPGARGRLPRLPGRSRRFASSGSRLPYAPSSRDDDPYGDPAPRGTAARRSCSPDHRLRAGGIRLP
jgi:hypothetical protein